PIVQQVDPSILKYVLADDVLTGSHCWVWDGIHLQTRKRAFRCTRNDDHVNLVLPIGLKLSAYLSGGANHDRRVRPFRVEYAITTDILRKWQNANVTTVV